VKANTQFLSGKWLLLISTLALLSPCCSSAINLLVYNKNNSGPGSLQQAINDNAALGGGNTIIFSNVVTGTLTLTAGELLITKNVTILGPGAKVLTISGNHASRVFHFTNVTATVSGLTIANGLVQGFIVSDGGGICSERAILTVSNCHVTGNSARDSGGGICNIAESGNATLIVSGCTFSGNSSDTGGGIFNATDASSFGATLTVINSTFSSNSARAIGGIYQVGSGAAVTVRGCTFSDNSSDYGGAIELVGGSLTIGDTILKAGAPGENIFNYGGTVASLGYNISSDSGVVNTNGGTGALTGVGDQTSADPMLGPLQDNGGPAPTHMPLAGSPAIDQGKNLAGTATDQRGRARTFDNPVIPTAAVGDGSDIGAVEVYPEMSLVVSNTNDTGTGSLRRALEDAAPGDAVVFSPAVTGTITLTSGELLINKSIPIYGPGAKILAINGNAASRVLHSGGVTASISGLTITNGNAVGSFGSGICNSQSTLTVSNCTLAGNSATIGGGGIYNDGFSGTARLSVIASTLSGNSGAFGGAIDNVGTSGSATLTVSNSTLANNSAGTDGGAIFSTGQSGGSASLAVIGCTFSSNSASTLGGGIFNNINSTLTIGDTILKTGASGANLVNSSGTVTSRGYNLSSDNGGGLLAATGDQINTDPKLGPLKDNGGPTPTMALLSNSPAIDKGKNFGLTTDQRGAPRPFDFASTANAVGGDGSDIGAFELGRPQINIQRAGNNAILSWPSYYGDFSLQSSTNVALPGAWLTLGGNASVVGNQYQQTNGPIFGNRFFRLKQ
jgi:hypothetical protein